LITGSRNCLTAVKTFLDGQQTDGIVLAPCSETVIDVPRIDGLRGNGGDGIRLVDSSNITLRNTSFEGKNGRSCIRIENSSNITLDNCNMGGAPAANVEYAALWITGNSKNIRIDGGLINVFDIAGIRIDAGSRSVRGRAIEFGQSSGAAMTTFLNVAPAAADIRIETFTGTDAGVEFAQTVGKALFRGTTLLLQRWEDLRVTGLHTIENIAQGDDGDGPSFGSASAGRRVTLFLSGGAVTVASGLPSAIRLSSGVAWTPPGDAMLELVFDGALWWEVARNG